MYIKINKIGKQEVGIWWAQKWFLRYEACDQISHFCHQYLLRKMRRKMCIYVLLWVAFLNPSYSYFLFADLVVFLTHWTYIHIFRHLFLSNCWWQKSDILWPNITFLPSIFAEKNETKNVHICSMCIKTNKVGKQEIGIWQLRHKLHICTPYRGKRFLTRQIPDGVKIKTIKLVFAAPPLTKQH
jgi:hypothetical protein